jgi:hypothetical protein
VDEIFEPSVEEDPQPILDFSTPSDDDFVQVTGVDPDIPGGRPALRSPQLLHSPDRTPDDDLFVSMTGVNPNMTADEALRLQLPIPTAALSHEPYFGYTTDNMTEIRLQFVGDRARKTALLAKYRDRHQFPTTHAAVTAALLDPGVMILVRSMRRLHPKSILGDGTCGSRAIMACMARDEERVLGTIPPNELPETHGYAVHSSYRTRTIQWLRTLIPHIQRSPDPLMQDPHRETGSGPR